MPSITFQPVLRDLKDILKSDFYFIPRFQRPYSWSSENLDDFWRDVVLDNDEGYFIGPMVAYGKGKEAYGIVDGQQRLTSITLALCVLRDMYQSLGEANLANGLAKYIERQDDDSVSHYVLRSEAAAKYLKSQIQAPLPRVTMEAKTEEERALRKAFDDIAGWLKEKINGLSTERADDEPSPAAVRLREVRDRILSLQIIWIQIDSEDDAYVIFETLNSRGKDLEVVDLLKNLLLASIRAENGDLDSARLRWSEMRETLANAGGGANPNKFILHWWLSQYDYSAERKLYRLIKKQHVKSAASAMLDSLRHDSELYAKIARPEDWRVHQNERRINESLRALNIFAVRQPRPLLLALMRAHRDSLIKLGKLSNALWAIEAYHYVSTAVVGVSSTGGISMMYASHAREISNASSSSQVHAAIDALVDKLQGRLSPRDTFISEFPRSLHYTEDAPDAKRLVQYTLRKLHDATVTGMAMDHSQCNIEHLSPQADAHEWSGEIGNLLWVDANLNAALSNKPFLQKRELLRSKEHAYDFEDILASDQWGRPEVSLRSRRLAELAYDKVWKLKA